MMPMWERLRNWILDVKCRERNVDNMKWLELGATTLSYATKLTGSKLAKKSDNTQLFYIMCYVALFIMATEKEVRKLQVGDKIKWFSDSDEEAEIIKSIIFDNPEDLKNRFNDRVTINGLHWGFANITIVECAANAT